MTTAAAITAEDVQAIELQIARTDFFTAAQGVEGANGGPAGLAQAVRWGMNDEGQQAALVRLTTVVLCVVTMKDGFVQVGVAYGPLDRSLFDLETSKGIARKDAMDKLLGRHPETAAA